MAQNHSTLVFENISSRMFKSQVDRLAELCWSWTSSGT